MAAAAAAALETADFVCVFVSIYQKSNQSVWDGLNQKSKKTNETKSCQMTFIMDQSNAGKRNLSKTFQSSNSVWLF